VRPLHVGLAACALLAGTIGYVVERHISSPALEKAAERPVTIIAEPETPLDWSFLDLHGDSVPLERWRGKLLVVNFWATWCPPCLREIPAFIELQRRYAADGVQFVGIALDQTEAVASFASEKAMNYPVLVGHDDVIRFMQSLGNGIGGLPYTAVIDANGELLTTHQGEWKLDVAERALLSYMEHSKSAAN